MWRSPPTVALPGLAAFDPVVLRDRLVRDRIERQAGVRPVVDAVALVPVLERDGLLRLIARNDAVREPVDRDRAVVAAEIGMRARDPAGAQERDVRRRVRVERRGGDVEVPPVGLREERQRRRHGPAERGRGRAERDQRGGGEEEEEPGSGSRCSPPRGGRCEFHSEPFEDLLPQLPYAKAATKWKTSGRETRPSGRA